VLANLAERNITRGIWIDIHSKNVTIGRNLVRDNGDRGIEYEISDRGTIAGNTVLRNGASGLVVLESTNVLVYNNTFDHNRRAIDVIDGPRPESLSHVTMRNNLFSGTRSDTDVLLNVNDITNKRSAEAMGVSADFNAYSRQSASAPKFLVAWSSSPNPIRVFTSVANFRAQTGAESNGSGVDGLANPWYVDPGNGDFRLAPGSSVLGRAVALPSAVAAALGVAPGSVLDPGAP
jgi:parallel beta-helix repeat protein